jgi:hypothetical protein
LKAKAGCEHAALEPKAERDSRLDPGERHRRRIQLLKTVGEKNHLAIK